MAVATMMCEANRGENGLAELVIRGDYGNQETCMQSLIQRLSSTGYSKYLSIKKQAKRLQKAAPGILGQEFPLHKCQEAIARSHGYSNWHELTTHAQAEGLDKDAPFWRIRARNDVHEAILEALIDGEIALGEKTIILEGKLETTPAIYTVALTLFLEEISSRKIPGLVLVDTRFNSFQETTAWEAVERIGMEDTFNKFAHVDLRDRDMDFCFLATPREWTRAFFSFLPFAAASKFEFSGAAMIFEKVMETLLSTGRHKGEFVRPDTVFYAWDIMSSLSHGVGFLRQDLQTVNVTDEFGSMIARHGEQAREGVAYALPRIETVLGELKKYRFGNFVIGGAYESTRPTIVLFDSQDDASTFLAMLHAQISARKSGNGDFVPTLLLRADSEGGDHLNTDLKIPARGESLIMALGHGIREESVWRGTSPSVLAKKMVRLYTQPFGETSMTTSGKQVVFTLDRERLRKVIRVKKSTPEVVVIFVEYNSEEHRVEINLVCDDDDFGSVSVIVPSTMITDAGFTDGIEAVVMEQLKQNSSPIANAYALRPGWATRDLTGEVEACQEYIANSGDDSTT